MPFAGNPLGSQRFPLFGSGFAHLPEAAVQLTRLGALQLKTGASQRRTSPRAAILRLIVAYLIAVCPSSAQSNSDTIRGVVINNATHEPIARALVYSPDNRFATMTNSEGRFEFNLPQENRIPAIPPSHACKPEPRFVPTYYSRASPDSWPIPTIRRRISRTKMQKI